MALLLLNLNRPDEAASQLQRIIELQPSNADAHYDLGVLLLNQGKLEQAVEALNKAAKLDPSDQNKQKALQEAIERLKKVNEDKGGVKLPLIHHYRK